MDLDTKLTAFDKLVDNYIEIINILLDISISNNLLPMRILITVPFLRDYIKTNRVTLLEHGIIFLLNNKESLKNRKIKKFLKRRRKGN